MGFGKFKEKLEKSYGRFLSDYEKVAEKVANENPDSMKAAENSLNASLMKAEYDNKHK